MENKDLPVAKRSFKRPGRGYGGDQLICFFCLRRIDPGEAKVVVIRDELLGMEFKVPACHDCYVKYGDRVVLGKEGGYGKH